MGASASCPCLKAYAKLHGSYEAIVGGRVDDGIADLVGGIQGYDDLEKMGAAASDGTLWHKITTGINAGYLMGAGSNSGSDSHVVQGIAQGHAYSVLAAVQLVNKGQSVQLLKLRNPWGQTEWEGEWSDAWVNANAASHVKKQLKWSKDDDGMFWIKLPDFLLNYSTLYTVRLFNQGWTCVELDGRWEGRHAAGCDNYRKLGENPQFLVTVSRPAHLIIMFSQVDEGERDHTFIGASMLDMRGKRATRQIREVISTGSYTNLRSVTMENERLEPSRSGEPYTLVCTTFHPGSFYSDEENSSADNDTGFKLTCYCDDKEGFKIEPLDYD